MSKNCQKRQLKHQNFNEINTTQTEAKPKSSFLKKRISITSAINNFSKPLKIKQQDSYRQKQQPPMQPSKEDEKDKIIKQLQEQILEKKVKCDMVQEAFRRRHQIQQPLIKYANSTQVLAQGCKILAESNKSFKKVLFRSIVTILQISNNNKPKAMKALFIWIVSWVTHLFAFLSTTLIKK